MKITKLFLSAVIAVATTLGVSAQPMAGYKSSTSVTSYAMITDGTQMNLPTEFSLPAKAEVKTYNEATFQKLTWSGSADAITEKTAGTTGFDIGFNFKWGEKTMTKFAISPMFGLYFGESTIDVDPAALNMLDESSISNVAQFCNWNKYLFQIADSKISYKVEGTAPNRTLVVQWENLWLYMSGYSFSGEDADTVSFQMRLNEADSSLEMVFIKGWPLSYTGNRYNQLGIKGENNDIHCRHNATSGMSKDWTMTRLSTTVQNLYYDGTESNVESGFTFKFVPGAPCATPTVQPTNFVAVSTTNKVALTFDLPYGQSDYYLVTWSDDPQAVGAPEDQKVYNAGDALAENVTVLAYEQTPYSDDIANITVDHNGLDASKNYYYTAYAVNSFGAGGPKYNLVDPAKVSVVTKPSAPTSVKVISTNYKTTKVQVEANAAQNDVIVTQHCKAVNPYQVDVMVKGTEVVGDSIESYGAVVVYRGPAAEFEVKELTPGQTYTYIAYSLTANNDASSEYVETTCETWGEVPYCPDFTGYGRNQSPAWDGDVDPTVESAASDQVWIVNDTRIDGVSTNYLTRKLAASTGGETELITPWIMAEPKELLFSVNYKLFGLGFRGANALRNTWADDDYFKVSISKDGTNWEDIKVIDKTNNPQFTKTQSNTEYATLKAAFNLEESQAIKVRISWKFTEAGNAFLYGISLIERPKTEAPETIEVTEIAGSTATVAWSGRELDESYNLRYREVGSEEWIREEKGITAHSFELSGLLGFTEYEVQVAAVQYDGFCTSEWKSLTFVSGYTAPLSIDLKPGVPEFWTLTGDWAYANNKYFKGIAMQSSKATDSWVYTPVIDMTNEPTNLQVEFDITALKVVENSDVKYDICIIYEDTVEPEPQPEPEPGVETVAEGEEEQETETVSKVLRTLVTVDLAAAAPEGETFSYKLNQDFVGKEVQFAIHAYSENDDPSQVVVSRFGVMPSCKAPENLAFDVKYYTAVATWEGDADKYEYNFRKAGENEWNVVEVTTNTFEMTNLSPETKYEARVRAICDENDQSAWTYVETFTTTAVPECPAPYNLQVTNVDTNSAELSWEADSFNTEWMLRWRATDETSWNEVPGLTETHYTLTGIGESRVYVWRVRGYCDEGVLESNLSEQNRFETTSGLNALRINNIGIQAKGGVLNVSNDGALINRIDIVALDGKVLGSYEVNSTDNVLINTGITSTHVIVRVVTDGKARNFRVRF